MSVKSSFPTVCSAQKWCFHRDGLQD